MCNNRAEQQKTIDELQAELRWREGRVELSRLNHSILPMHPSTIMQLEAQEKMMRDFILGVGVDTNTTTTAAPESGEAAR